MRVLFLTACVSPGNMLFTKLTDVRNREKQYVAAIRWYLDNTKYQILVVENTNTDMSHYFTDEINKGRLEMLTFSGNNYPPILGKGYGESLILEYGLNKSIILKQADSFVKITGRLICKNINTLLKSCDNERFFYAAIKKGMQRELLLESRIFVAPIKILNLLIEQKECLNDSKYYYFEHLLFDIRSKWIANGGQYKEPWIPFNIIGQSGSTGNVYSGLTVSQIIKFYCKRIMHSLDYYI